MRGCIAWDSHIDWLNYIFFLKEIYSLKCTFLPFSLHVTNLKCLDTLIISKEAEYIGFLKLCNFSHKYKCKNKFKNEFLKYCFISVF